MHAPNRDRERDTQSNTRILSRWVRLNLARADRMARETLQLYQEDVGPIEADLVGQPRRVKPDDEHQPDCD